MGRRYIPKWKPGRRNCSSCWGGSGTWLDGQWTLQTKSYPAKYICTKCARKKYPHLFPVTDTRKTAFWQRKPRRRAA